MNCKASNAWLLAARATAAPPAEVRQHLQDCRRCRRRRRRLRELDEQLVLLAPAAPERSEAKTRFLEQINQLPPRPGLKIVKPRRLRLLYLATLPAAAALLVAVGVAAWFLARPGQNNGVANAPTQPETPATVREKPAPRPEDALADRLADHDLRLAEARTAEEQVQVLTAMAADLRAEALRRGGQETPEGLAHVAGLYDHVIRKGLAVRARDLSAARRQELARQLEADALASRENEKKAPQAAQKHLHVVVTAAGDAAAALTEDNRTADVAPPKKLPAATADTRLLEVMVLQGIRAADEKDPLKRADAYAAVAEGLAQAILQTTDADRAEALGKQLGDVLERGVAGNLARSDGSRAEIEAVGSRVAKLGASLEKQMQAGDAANRDGLRRALEASKAGRERAQEASQRKG